MPRFEKPEVVEIIEHRWYITIQIQGSDGTLHDFTASADRSYTDGDGIWFGSRAEYEEEKP